MKVEVIAVTETQKKLEVALPANTVQEELAKAYRQLSLRARVKGFRQGRIPRHVLEGLYGNEVRAQTVSGLVDRSLSAAIEESSLDVIGRPRLELGDLREGADFSFSAVVEIKPTIEIKDYGEIEVERVKVEVQEEQITESLRRLQEHNAQLEPVEERDVVAQGDFVFVDFIGEIDGNPIPGGKTENYSLLVGEGRTNAEFEDALIGLTKGCEATVKLHAPNQSDDTETTSKDVTLKVTVNDIKKRILPTLDDDFAKDCGDCESLQDLREKARKELQKELDLVQARQLKDQIVKKMVEQYDFVASPTLVDSELTQMVSRSQAQQGSAGADRAEARTAESLRDELRPEAERRVKAMLLLDRVIENEKIVVPVEEVNRRIESVASAAGDQGKAVRDYYVQEDARNELKYQLVSEKALEFLLNNVTIRDVAHPDNAVEALSEKG